MKYAVEEEQERSPRRSLGRRAAEEPEDTEITLGARSLLGIFFGLILVCGVFFALGYSVGRVSNVSPAPAADTASLTQSGDSQAKPSPQQTTVVPPATPADAPAASAAVPPATTATPGTVTVPASTAAPAPVVANAAPPAPNAAPARVSFPAANAGGPITPAPQRAAVITRQAPGWLMVQVAAVSVPQDAQILVAALRRHGFTPVVRHEPEDQLLHVQVGPFATRAQANAMRGALMAEGYNAVIR